MLDIQSAKLRISEEKRKIERRNRRGKIEWPHLLRRAAITRGRGNYTTNVKITSAKSWNLYM